MVLVTLHVLHNDVCTVPMHSYGTYVYTQAHKKVATYEKMAPYVCRLLALYKYHSKFISKDYNEYAKYAIATYTIPGMSWTMTAWPYMYMSKNSTSCDTVRR